MMLRICLYFITLVFASSGNVLLTLLGENLDLRYLQHENYCFVERSLFLNLSIKTLSICEKFINNSHLLCVSKSPTVNSSNIFDFNSSHQLWTYNIASVESNLSDSVSVSLDEVYYRPRIMVQTSFILNETPEDDSAARDILFILREQEDVAGAAVSFLRRHVPSTVIRPGDEDPMKSPAFQTLYSYMVSQLQREIAMRRDRRSAARELVQSYIRHCPGGIRVGIGEGAVYR